MDESGALGEDSSRLETTHKKDFDPGKILEDDDWGSLDFNPTFVGEYKVPSREIKVEKKEEAENHKVEKKEETKNQSTLPESMSNNFVAASQTSSPHISSTLR